MQNLEKLHFILGEKFYYDFMAMFYAYQGDRSFMKQVSIFEKYVINFAVLPHSRECIEYWGKADRILRDKWELV